MSFPQFTETDQPTMSAFNKKFQEIINLGVKAVYGQYKGTGAYGKSNPTSISFPGKPLMVIVANGGLRPGDLSSWSSSFIYIQGQSTFSLRGGTQGTITNTIKQEDKSLIWYADNTANSPNNQLNNSSITYNYFAVCEGGAT